MNRKFSRSSLQFERLEHRLVFCNGLQQPAAQDIIVSWIPVSDQVHTRVVAQGNTLIIEGTDYHDTVQVFPVTGGGAASFLVHNAIEETVGNTRRAVGTDHFRIYTGGLPIYRVAFFGKSGDDSFTTGFRPNTATVQHVFADGGPGVDAISGSAGSDVLVGRGEGDTLQGQGGNDLLIGSDGDDTLKGGSGHDILLGGDGGDTLEGDSGNDLLDGGGFSLAAKFFGGPVKWIFGHDTLKGGPDADLFVTSSSASWVIDFGLVDANKSYVHESEGDVPTHHQVEPALFAAFSSNRTEAGATFSQWMNDSRWECVVDDIHESFWDLPQMVSDANANHLLGLTNNSSTEQGFGSFDIADARHAARDALFARAGRLRRGGV